ncbi:DUF5998 family protein [Rudaeicoccus suwonensis]|uniref:Phosphodiesterase n=1 Tax=Rudaeicoccus suwonensis TaxID=657409 RepID=A0A561EBI5_9MICO|nr:DUF5998 family protein [Rudaeicoccus suwonensis]TWE12976.1 hypothetical protein BKA23_1804 [Rudaeicoccus suwonensis]
MASRSEQITGAVLPQGLLSDIEQAGYFPALVADVVATAVGTDLVLSHLVHAETTIDNETVRRHVTVVALTSRRLIVAHADDHTPTPESPVAHLGSVATATTETVPLSAVRGVMLAHVMPSPETYVEGSLGREVTVTISWGAVSRVDLLPATCGDPDCGADHGYEGSIAGDDIALRVSADADGDANLQQALDFSRALSAAIGQ